MAALAYGMSSRAWSVVVSSAGGNPAAQSSRCIGRAIFLRMQSLALVASFSSGFSLVDARFTLAWIFCAHCYALKRFISGMFSSESAVSSCTDPRSQQWGLPCQVTSLSSAVSQHCRVSRHSTSIDPRHSQFPGTTHLLVNCV